MTYRKLTPYRTLSELPEQIREQLPEHAQEIYRAAYNRSLEKANVSENAADNNDPEATAHQTALLKVQNEYEQDQHGYWQRRPVGESIDKDKIRDV